MVSFCVQHPSQPDASNVGAFKFQSTLLQTIQHLISVWKQTIVMVCVTGIFRCVVKAQKLSLVYANTFMFALTPGLPSRSCECEDLSGWQQMQLECICVVDL